MKESIAMFQLLRKEEIKEQSYYLIDRKYDDELGLQLDLEESSSEAIIF